MACVLALCSYIVLAISRTVAYVSIWLQPEIVQHAWWAGLRTWSSDRALAVELGLNALGLVCAEVRRQTCAALGRSLLPRLIGAQRARKLTLRQLTARYGFRVLRHVPNLWRYSPPPFMVACIIAVERLAPLLLPSLVLLMRLGYLPSSALLLAFSAFALIVCLEYRSIPQAPLRRLPFLIPSAALSPHAREALGYGLEAAARVEVTRAKVWGWLRPFRHQLRRHSSSITRRCKDTLQLQRLFSSSCGREVRMHAALTTTARLSPPTQ